MRIANPVTQLGWTANPAQREHQGDTEHPPRQKDTEHPLRLEFFLGPISKKNRTFAVDSGERVGSRNIV